MFWEYVRKHWRRAAKWVLAYFGCKASCLALITVFFLAYPEKVLEYNYFIHLTRLNLLKREMARKAVGGGVVFLYGEKTTGEMLQMKNLEQLWPIVEKAHVDFLDFVPRHHHLMLQEKRIGTVKLVLVSPYTFHALGLKLKKKSDDLDPIGHQNKRSLYLQRTDHSFDISVHKETIRHELFHFFSWQHGIVHLLPEHSAGLFEDKKN